MTTPGEPSRYAVSLDALERSAHVPVEEQHTEQAEAPNDHVKGEWETEVSWFLRYGGG